MNNQKILIIQTAFIGDVILATSLIEFIKKLAPNTQIDFLLRKGNETLIQTHPAIQKVYIWNKKQEKYKGLFSLIKQIRKQKYDTVLNIQRFFNSGLITAFSGAKRKVGFKQNPLSFLFSHKIQHRIPHKENHKYLHEVQRNLQLYLALNKHLSICSDQDLKPKLYFTEQDQQKIDELSLDTPYFVLAPSSVWFTKQWQIKKWKELIALLPQDQKICLIGAPSDEAAISPLLGPSNVLNLVGKLSLRESALLMKKAKRVFVNDSAPLHLASAVNANTTAIFCSTTPSFGYYPLSDNSIVIETKEVLDCKPCGLHGHKQCPKGHFKCSESINTLDVLNTVS